MPVKVGLSVNGQQIFLNPGDARTRVFQFQLAGCEKRTGRDELAAPLWLTVIGESGRDIPKTR